MYTYQELGNGATYEVYTHDPEGRFAAYLYGYGPNVGFAINIGEGGNLRLSKIME